MYNFTWTEYNKITKDQIFEKQLMKKYLMLYKTYKKKLA